MNNVVEIERIQKTYASGQVALKEISLGIRKGEILALLGPNGAGKTTLISIICGLTVPSGGQIRVGGFDVVTQFRQSRALIGLVPQEIPLEPFERVHRTVAFSRGLFGKPRNDAFIEQILRDLSLWDKRDARIMELSGGMKRRVLIAKALSHEPEVLFLDEPTAGVDVELRKDMWAVVERLKASGVTIILTTHYIEEAEAIADRIGVINAGRLLLVEETRSLMHQMGRKELHIELHSPIHDVPAGLAAHDLELSEDGCTLIFTYDRTAERTGITRLLSDLTGEGLALRDLRTRQSSLEEIFVDLVSGAEV